MALTLTEAETQRDAALAHLTEIRERGISQSMKGRSKSRAALTEALNDFKYWQAQCYRLGEAVPATAGIRRQRIVNY